MKEFNRLSGQLTILSIGGESEEQTELNTSKNRALFIAAYFNQPESLRLLLEENGYPFLISFLDFLIFFLLICLSFSSSSCCFFLIF